jgi:hypothetical protein
VCRPANLTENLKRNKGTFPRDLVFRVIDGRERVPGHGGPDMPAWGDAFTRSIEGGDKDAVVDPGGEMPVKVPELYNPSTDEWTDVAPHQRDRTYHHTAVLMPDMRVLLGGHVPIAAYYGGKPRDQGPATANNDADPSFEIYSPPYLTRGERPTISSAQKGVAYGEAFDIGTPQADDIESVLFMRMPSVQHTIDGDQRSLLLDFKKTGAGTLQAMAPPNSIAAPPGVYYLVVNRKTAQGPVPSVARMVTVGLGTDKTPAADPFGAQTAAPGGGGASALNDSSVGAEARSAAVAATKDSPAGPAVAQLDGEAAKMTAPGSATPPAIQQKATENASAAAETALAAKPANSSSPLPSPAFPVVAVGAAGMGAALVSRRVLRRVYARARP